METLKGLRLTFPVQGDFIITDLFASPRPYKAWGLEFQHEGIDVAPLPAGRRARACAAYDGVISARGYDTEFMGGWTEMFHNYHGGHFYTRFHHMAEQPIEPGWFLKAGQTIGIIGDTGYATGVHLHFMVMVDRGGRRVPIDPLPFFDQSIRNSIPARG